MTSRRFLICLFLFFFSFSFFLLTRSLFSFFFFFCLISFFKPYWSPLSVYLYNWVTASPHCISTHAHIHTHKKNYHYPVSIYFLPLSLSLYLSISPSLPGKKRVSSPTKQLTTFKLFDNRKFVIT